MRCWVFKDGGENRDARREGGEDVGWSAWWYLGDGMEGWRGIDVVTLEAAPQPTWLSGYPAMVVDGSRDGALEGKDDGQEFVWSL